MDLRDPESGYQVPVSQPPLCNLVSSSGTQAPWIRCQLMGQACLAPGTQAVPATGSPEDSCSQPWAGLGGPHTLTPGSPQWVRHHCCWKASSWLTHAPPQLQLPRIHTSLPSASRVTPEWGGGAVQTQTNTPVQLQGPAWHRGLPWPGGSRPIKAGPRPLLPARLQPPLHNYVWYFPACPAVGGGGAWGCEHCPHLGLGQRGARQAAPKPGAGG